jgi:hypothetical protein
MSGLTMPQHVCVIPVRMQEAWLLFDEAAIRKAAGNPNGKDTLSIPPLRKLEDVPDPKALLHDLLKTASGLKGGRLKRFDPHKSASRITAYVDDFAPLRALPAFASLEDTIKQIKP